MDDTVGRIVATGAMVTEEVVPITPLPEARAAALRPIRHQGRGFWLLAGGLAAVVVAGLAAWGVQLASGLGVAGYSNQAFWAIYEANLVAFIGVSYGGAVTSAILRLTGASWRAPLTRIAEATALVTLPIGMLFIIPHLGQPVRIWELLVYPNFSSPILWDFIVVTSYLLATVVFFLLPLIPDCAFAQQALGVSRRSLRGRVYAALGSGWTGAPAQRQRLHRAIGLVAILVIPMAVFVHSVLSMTFSLSSRAGYHDSIFPPYFVIAALYSGVALVVLAVAAMRRVWHLEPFITPRHFVRLGWLLVAFDVTYLYLTFMEFLVDGYPGTTGEAAWAHELLVGRYWFPFWVYVVGGGLLPLLLLGLRRTRTVTGVVTA